MEDVTVESLRTKRFVAFILSLVVLGAVAIASISAEASEEVIKSILYPLAAFAAGYQGFGNWHDMVVRRSLGNKEGEA